MNRIMLQWQSLCTEPVGSDANAGLLSNWFPFVPKWNLLVVMSELVSVSYFQFCLTSLVFQS